MPTTATVDATCRVPAQARSRDTALIRRYEGEVAGVRGDVEDQVELVGQRRGNQETHRLPGGTLGAPRSHPRRREGEGAPMLIAQREGQQPVILRPAIGRARL